MIVPSARRIEKAGPACVVYWEPAWVSTKCGTRWGRGSNWENAAWSDYKRHEALPAFDFLSAQIRARGGSRAPGRYALSAATNRAARRPTSSAAMPGA